MYTYIIKNIATQFVIIRNVRSNNARTIKRYT